MMALTPPPLRDAFWQLPLALLTTAEWEALCDGCGRCCLHKLQDEDDDQVYYTDVACKLLDLRTCQCSRYSRRLQYLPDCMSIRAEGEAVYAFLPHTCAYRLRHAGQPLPEWHPLLTGDRQAMRLAGIPVHGRVISERQLGDLDLEERIIRWIH